MTLLEYRTQLGWSAEELARQAGINAQTVRRIEKGLPTYIHTAGAIASALSRGLGRDIKVQDIEDLVIRD